MNIVEQLSRINYLEMKMKDLEKSYVKVTEENNILIRHNQALEKENKKLKDKLKKVLDNAQIDNIWEKCTYNRNGVAMLYSYINKSNIHSFKSVW